MTLSLTDERKNKIKTLLIHCLHSYQISTRELARIFGNIVASFPAVTFGSLHYRYLERDEISGLKYHPNPEITIHTDISLTGWGITNGISPSRGLWYKAELDHINVLELKAIEIGIYTYCKNKTFLHVRVMCDNVTAIAYINNMGGIKSGTCNNIACRICNCCTENKLWV